MIWITYESTDTHKPKHSPEQSNVRRIIALLGAAGRLYEAMSGITKAAENKIGLIMSLPSKSGDSCSATA